MFHTPSINDEIVLANYFGNDIQAKPKELIPKISSRLLHIRSLCSGLKNIKDHLVVVLDALRRCDDSEWCLYEDKIAHKLTAGTILLAGILDGLVVCAGNHVIDKSTSFYTSNLHRPDLVTLQDEIKALSSGSSRYADFWTIVNFWKHYYPYQPRPSQFTREQVRDFSVNIGEGKSTGPILHDLIVPTFNRACKIAIAIAGEEMLDTQYTISIAIDLAFP